MQKQEYTFVSVRLTKQEKTELENLARERDSSMSKVARKAILRELRESRV